jgi:DNA-binding transcriptional ArsR family regulator
MVTTTGMNPLYSVKAREPAKAATQADRGAQLREAGFVEARVDAQRRLYRIRPEPLMEVDAWLAPFRRFWSTHVDALERHLDRMDQVSPAKGKKR